jgi:hypothetical protein
VIDPVAAGVKFQAVEVEISLDTRRLGGISQAQLVGQTAPIPTDEEGGRLTFAVCPDPVASILLH